MGKGVLLGPQAAFPPTGIYSQMIQYFPVMTILHFIPTEPGGKEST